jgi:transposase
VSSNLLRVLSDRQAAEAVRSRIDWKYALSLDLADPGFDFSILSKFRGRLLAGSAEMTLLETMLERFKEHGLLKARGKQRTDSTHVTFGDPCPQSARMCWRDTTSGA